MFFIHHGKLHRYSLSLKVGTLSGHSLEPLAMKNVFGGEAGVGCSVKVAARSVVHMPGRRDQGGVSLHVNHGNLFVFWNEKLEIV